MTADLTPSLRDAAAVVERIARRTDDATELAALRLLAGLVPGEGVELRYGAENVRAYVDGIVAGLTGRQHYVAPLEVMHRPADEHDDPITWCDCRPSDTPGGHPGPCRLLARGRVPATTPGDDRGRELAERVERIRFNLAAAEGLMPMDREQIEATLTALERLRDDLRALAAPAATKAGDVARFGSDQERVEIGIYGLARCLVAACNPDTYAHVSEVERATPDDAPWGEVDSLLATHDRLGDEALARRLGIDVEQYANDDLPIGERIDEILAATPPAQGPAETASSYVAPGAPRGKRYDRLRALIEWVSERDHGRAVALDGVVHEIEQAARLAATPQDQQ